MAVEGRDLMPQSAAAYRCAGLGEGANTRKDAGSSSFPGRMGLFHGRAQARVGSTSWIVQFVATPVLSGQRPGEGQGLGAAVPGVTIPVVETFSRSDQRRHRGSGDFGAGVRNGETFA